VPHASLSENRFNFFLVLGADVTDQVVVDLYHALNEDIRPMYSCD